MTTSSRSSTGAHAAQPTIREIAELAGVSIATVSRVVNGSGYVSERRAARSRASSASTATRRTAARAALSGGRTGLIGVTVPRIHPAYFSVIVAGVAEALYEHDMRIVLCPTLHEHDREVSLLERLMHGTTDGGLLVLPEESSQRAAHADEPRLPLRRRRPAPSGSTSGCRRSPPRTPPAPTRRRATCSSSATGASPRSRARAAGSRPRSASAATGRRSRPRACSPTPSSWSSRTSSVAGGREAAAAPARRCPSRRPRSSPSTTSSRSARCRPRTRAGCAIPDDLSVVGFDDTAEAEIVTPALTTVRQPLAEMGRMAVSLLTRLLENQRLEALHVELATRLVVRGSTAPPRLPG